DTLRLPRPHGLHGFFRQRRSLTVARDEPAFAAGCAAAQSDIAAGRLVFRWSGHARHWGHWIVNQLEERLCVTVDQGLGVCSVTEASVAFNDGYKTVVIAEIDRRHGSGAFQAVVKESRAQSEESLAHAKEIWLERHEAG